MSMSYASHLFSNNSSVCDGDDEFLPHSVNFPTDQTYTLSAQGAQLVDLFTVKREKFEEQFDYLLHCPHEISPCASQSASQQQPSSLSYEENDISESNSNISETKLNVKETDKSTHSFPLTTTTSHVVIKQEPTDDDDIASQCLPPPTPFEPEFVKSAFVAMKQKKIANDVDDIKVPLKSQEKRLNREDLIDLHVKATLEKYCSKIASLEQCRFVVKIARRNRLSGKRSSMYDEAIADIVRSRLFEKDLIRISNDHLFDVVGMPLQEKFEQFKSSIVYIKKIQPLLVVVALLLNSRESFDGKRMLPSTKSDGDCLKALVKNGTEKAFKMHRDGQVTFRGESWRAKTIKRPKLARLLSQPLHDTDIVYHFEAVKKPAKKATKKVDEDDDDDEEYVGNKTDSARQHNTRTTKRRYRKRTHDDDDYKGKPVPTVAVATRATRKRRCVTAAAAKK